MSVSTRGSAFVKPNIDKVLYLFSDKAKKTLSGSPSKVMEYRWDIPSITLNDWGKITMMGVSYKSLDPTVTPIITRIRNVATKNNYDSWNGNGAILNVSTWNFYAPFNQCLSVPLAPQTLNSIFLSLNDDLAQIDNGIVDSTAVFVIILKITEDDVPQTEWGDSKAVNVRQMSIPTYNNYN